MSDLRKEALRRGILISSGGKSASRSVILASIVELANLGWFVSEANISGLTEEELIDTVRSAQEIIGADRDMIPVYPGFPKQVQELSSLTLIVEQLLHYWSRGVLMPDYPNEIRPGFTIEEALASFHREEELTVRDLSEFSSEIVFEVIRSKVAIGKPEAVLLQEVLTASENGWDILRSVVSRYHARNDENWQHLAKVALSLGVTPESVMEVFGKGSINGVLRVFLLCYGKVSKDSKNAQESFDRAVYSLSNKDAWSVAFRKVPRPSRRVVVSALGAGTRGFNADSLIANRDLWRRVVRTIHGFEHSVTLEQTRALDIISGNVDYRTLNSSVEEAMKEGDVIEAVTLLADNQPGNLLRRVVALLRLVETKEELNHLVKAIGEVGESVSFTTLVSAYNGILSANDQRDRLIRVSGRSNNLVERYSKKVPLSYLKAVLLQIVAVIAKVIEGDPSVPAPGEVVGVGSKEPVPLVRRDGAFVSGGIERGAILPLGEGNIVRIFGHWVNNMTEEGYVDVAGVLLNNKLETLGVSDWRDNSRSREWSTYSGDKLVYPGDSAAEYVDVDVKKVLDIFPDATYLVMSVQSWSGFPLDQVDFLAGSMVRNDGEAGEVFEPRTVATAFTPSQSKSLQAIPLVVDLRSREMIWVDSSSGSDKMHESASGDDSIGSIVYDEVVRPKLTIGELSAIWASVYGVKTSNEPAANKELLKALL